VTVRDTTAPTLTCPSDFTAACTSASGANVTYSATATDLVDPSPTVSCSPVSGSLFAFGQTTVTCNASDHASPPNATSCTFHVTVSDTAAPSITCPANQVVEAVGPGGATASFVVTASDGCDLSPTLSVVPASGSLFPLGTTTVNATATDASNNSRSCSFTVTVRDTTPPSISCPGDQTVGCSAAGGAVVTFGATASDSVDPAPTIGCTPASGSTFPSGTTSVTCTATDASGNSRSCLFHVTVQDTTAPSITCPADLVLEAVSGAGALATFSIQATDACDANPAVASLPASGTVFPLGNTTVVATASDGAGNVSSCSFHVAVQDTTPPSITCPADLSVPCTSASGATVSFSATASDTVDPSPSIVCSPASGSTFTFGTTTVSCTAMDGTGNSRSCTFHVTVTEPNSCLTGNVNLAAGPSQVADVLRVNGSAGARCTREVIVPIGAPITVSLDAAPQGPTNPAYSTWVWRTSAQNSRTLVIGGTTIGCTVNPTPFDAAQSPQAFRCLRGGLGAEYCAGVREIAASPARGPWSLSRAAGFNRAVTFQLQSIEEDDGAGNAMHLSLTNTVVLRIQ
jgi:large repetitive protein